MESNCPDGRRRRRSHSPAVARDLSVSHVMSIKYDIPDNLICQAEKRKGLLKQKTEPLSRHYGNSTTFLGKSQRKIVKNAMYLCGFYSSRRPISHFHVKILRTDSLIRSSEMRPSLQALSTALYCVWYSVEHSRSFPARTAITAASPAP